VPTTLLLRHNDIGIAAARCAGREFFRPHEVYFDAPRYLRRAIVSIAATKG
jgi:hypothetical protein